MHIRGVARTDARVMREATTLAEHHYAVTIVDVEDGRERPAVEEIAGVRIRHLIPTRSFIRTRFKLRMLASSIYALLRSGADVYHAHDLSALPASYIASRLRRRPLIFDAHELPLAGLKGTRWEPFSGLFKRALSHILPRCAGVITVSPYIGREIRTSYHSPVVTLVRNIPPYQKMVKTDRLPKRLGLGPEVRIALYQGNVQRDRNLEILVRAASFLEPDTVLVVMGRADEAVLAQLQGIIEGEGLAERVKILPAVPYKELLEWTASADIGLVIISPEYSLNNRWCLPNKLFEYLMAGLPVLATSLDAVADLLSQYGVGRIVASLVPSEIGAAINSMLADHESLDHMRSRIGPAVEEDLNWEKEQDQLLHLYENVLPGTRRQDQ